MAIMIAITDKGIKDICIIAKDYRGGKELTALYQDIEPEVKTFEELINKKLNPDDSALASG